MEVGVGFSCALSSREAGAGAAREACRCLEKPVLVFLFTTEDYDQEAVLEEVLSRTGASRLVGACGAGVVTPEGICRRGIAVLAVRAEGVSAATALVSLGGGDAEEAGKRLAERLLSKVPAREGAVFIFPDGFAGGITEVLSGLYDVLGPEFRYAGGGTGDNLRFMKTYQMTEEGVASSSVAAALVTGCSFGVGVGHGWRSAGPPLVITRARGRVVYELDGQPALEVYLRRLGEAAPENFANLGARHPLGVVDVSGRYVIRDPLKGLPGGAVEFVTEVPPSAVAYLMTTTRDELLHASRDTVAAALRRVRVPRFALVFDCVSRSLLLGNGGEEAAAFREAFGSLPFAGLLTFGEAACYDDAPLFHNKTLVVAVGG